MSDETNEIPTGNREESEEAKRKREMREGGWGVRPSIENAEGPQLPGFRRKGGRKVGASYPDDQFPDDA